MEVHVVRGHTVQGPFGLGQQTKDGQGPFGAAGDQPCTRDGVHDVPGSAVVVLARHLNAHVGGGDPGPIDPLVAHGPARIAQAAAGRLDGIGVRAHVDKATQGHVPRYPGEGVEPGHPHWAVSSSVVAVSGLVHSLGRLSRRNTAQAAPKPLSMPTTVTPEAQLDSMASKAVTPSRAAP